MLKKGQLFALIIVMIGFTFSAFCIFGLSLVKLSRNYYFNRRHKLTIFGAKTKKILQTISKKNIAAIKSAFLVFIFCVK